MQHAAHQDMHKSVHDTDITCMERKQQKAKKERKRVGGNSGRIKKIVSAVYEHIMKSLPLPFY